MTNATRVEDGILRDAIAELDAANAKFKTEMERRSLIIEMDIGGYSSVSDVHPDDRHRDLGGCLFRYPRLIDIDAIPLSTLKMIRRIGRNRFRWNSPELEAIRHGYTPKAVAAGRRRS